MNKNFYVTTPIFYPTGLPHIGTAYCVFIADTLARYARIKGADTLFLTGTDEHGANIAAKATEEGKTPIEYVDYYADAYKEIWRKTKITNDYFMRTTNPEHEKFAQDLLQKSFDNGDIYEGSYEGWYCQSCEAYYTEADLVDGKCPNHPTKTPVYTKEKNYYFRWSKYQSWLLEYYEQNPDFILPAKWAEFVKNFVKAGLQDIPVTRANVKWGIPVPFDSEQTIYVWYDALPNYLSYLHFAENEKKGYPEKFWPDNVTHVVGKDILKFHAILWPAMLKSAGLEIPKHVLVTGFFTVNGLKIGKSNGNAISPVDLANEFGIDAVRYALLSEFQIGNDGDFSIERLKIKYQTELADSWGNLVNRVIHLSNKKSVGEVDKSLVDKDVLTKIEEAEKKYHQHFENFEVFEAIEQVNELTRFANKYITEKQPWSKENLDSEQVIKNLLYLIERVIILFKPIIPESSEKAEQMLKNRETGILFEKFE